MWAGIVTLFPEMFTLLDHGITSRAQKQGLVTIECFNPRTYTSDKHHSVDDKPFGGGPGMLMKAAPLSAAIAAAKSAAPSDARVIYVSPKGKLFDQAAALRFATYSALIFVAGRYEGIDERIITQEIDEEWSIGDYVLTGGELPVLVMLDASIRLLADVLGNEKSHEQDSLSDGLLKYPEYTRPAQFSGLTVPDALISGNHQQIETWRKQQSLGMTWLKRPDLLIEHGLTPEELALLQSFIEQWQANHENK